MDERGFVYRESVKARASDVVEGSGLSRPAMDDGAVVLTEGGEFDPSVLALVGVRDHDVLVGATDDPKELLGGGVSWGDVGELIAGLAASALFLEQEEEGDGLAAGPPVEDGDAEVRHRGLDDGGLPARVEIGPGVRLEGS